MQREQTASSRHHTTAAAGEVACVRFNKHGGFMWLKISVVAVAN
jgi:hypothetical protein